MAHRNVQPSQRDAGVNAQTGTSYTVADTDRNKLVTHTNASAIAVTLPQAGTSNAFLAGWCYAVENRGAGTVTITPTTSTIDGAASVALTTNQGCLVFSDGTNYFTMRGIGGTATGTVTSITFTAPLTGGTITSTGTVTSPAFVAAGGSHAAGGVPDPGSSSHSPAYYLGDDSAFHDLSGGGGGAGNITTTGAEASRPSA